MSERPSGPPSVVPQPTSGEHPDQNPEIVDPVDPGDQQGIAKVYAEHWMAPLPRPQDLREYDALAPGFAQELLESSIAQARHRMNTEQRVVETGSKATTRGQWMAFGLGIGGLGVALTMALVGYEGWAAGITIVQIVALSGSYIIGQLYHHKAEEE